MMEVILLCLEETFLLQNLLISVSYYLSSSFEIVPEPWGGESKDVLFIAEHSTDFEILCTLIIVGSQISLEKSLSAVDDGQYIFYLPLHLCHLYLPYLCLLYHDECNF